MSEDKKEGRSEARARMLQLVKANRERMAQQAEHNRRVAQAWDAWITSEKGEECMAEGAYGEYLRNRLWWAFMAGADSVQRQGGGSDRG